MARFQNSISGWKLFIEYRMSTGFIAIWGRTHMGIGDSNPFNNRITFDSGYEVWYILCFRSAGSPEIQYLGTTHLSEGPHTQTSAPWNPYNKTVSSHLTFYFFPLFFLHMRLKAPSSGLSFRLFHPGLGFLD